MPKIQHLALKTNGLLGTYHFYHERLGLPARYNLEVGRLWIDFDDDFRLIFDHSEAAPAPETVIYLGLELQNFEAVDALHARLLPDCAIERDMRETYRNTQGPYGFFIRDPNGYRLKVFHYHYPA